MKWTAIRSSGAEQSSDKMGWRVMRVGKRRIVSASELSRMGVCERLVCFEAKYGKRVSRHQKQAINRGKREHEHFFHQAVRTAPSVETSFKKPWCFLATLAWSESAKETQTLRRFRDEILRMSRTGRWLIKVYYRMSPRICRTIEGKPVLVSLLRHALRPVVWAAEAALILQKRRRRDE